MNILQACGMRLASCATGEEERAAATFRTAPDNFFEEKYNVKQTTLSAQKPSYRVPMGPESIASSCGAMGPMAHGTKCPSPSYGPKRPRHRPKPQSRGSETKSSCVPTCVVLLGPSWGRAFILPRGRRLIKNPRAGQNRRV